jgi:hypothetical protein
LITCELFRFSARFRVHIKDCDLATLLRKPQRYAPPDALSATGDDRHLVLQSAQLLSPSI